MKILITNDDGFEAEGINILSNVLSEQHYVIMVAPDKERSACSNAVTMRSEIVLKKIKDNQFSVTGFPADCVNIVLNGDIFPDIDLVISGINHGPNLGDDIYFSGTVAGARTAYIFGKTGISISINSYHKPSSYFSDAARFLLRFIEDIKDEILEEPLLFNINYPDLQEDDIKGIRYTTVGKRIYKDTYVRMPDDPDKIMLKSHGPIGSLNTAGSDVTELERGFISITPLHLDCTDYDYLSNKGAYINND